VRFFNELSNEKNLPIKKRQTRSKRKSTNSISDVSQIAPKTSKIASNASKKINSTELINESHRYEKMQSMFII
jgi:hypothetical protein